MLQLLKMESVTPQVQFLNDDVYFSLRVNSLEKGYESISPTNYG